MMTRIVFMGSPEFAVPSLRAITGNHSVVGVVTQPDRPAGRGREVRPPAVKGEAARLGLPVIQPQKLSDPAALRQLREWAPEIIIVAAFGQLLRPEVLRLPAHGCINVHASLLPRWRGAAPIQAAIAAGDPETGVTIMQMDEGLDTGGILAQRGISIEARDTGATLSAKLAEIGAELISAVLPGYLAGDLIPRPQDSSKATKAPSLRKDDGRLDPSLAADVLERRVRAYHPWPGTYLEWEGGQLKVHRAHAIPAEFPIGRRLVIEGSPALATANGVLLLDEVQPAGRRSMEGRAFILGARGWAT